MKSEKTLIKRFIPLIIILALLIAVAAIAPFAIAYYTRSSGEDSTEYTPAEPADPSFTLGDGNNSVSGVAVTVPDEGYPVYVRASVTVNWVGSESGDVYFGTPDYSMQLGENWKLTGNLYYYTLPVESGEKTGALFESFTLTSTSTPEINGEACVAYIKISVQTVQAIGSTDDDTKASWQDAWGIDSIS